MRTSNFDWNLVKDQRQIIGKLEDLLREADHRSTGGFRTEDEKFAWHVSEELRDILHFMYRTNELIDNMISSINDLEQSLDQHQEVIAKIEEVLTSADNLL